jgi:hypothetical protein
MLANIAMETPPECFEQAYYALKNGGITIDALVDLIVKHFDGTRHPQDSKVEEVDIKETSNRDLVGAAARICMADSSCTFPACEYLHQTSHLFRTDFRKQLF